MAGPAVWAGRGLASHGLAASTDRFSALGSGPSLGRRCQSDESSKADAVARTGGTEDLTTSGSDPICISQPLGTHRLNRFASLDACANARYRVWDNRYADALRAIRF